MEKEYCQAKKVLYSFQVLNCDLTMNLRTIILNLFLYSSGNIVFVCLYSFFLCH